MADVNGNTPRIERCRHAWADFDFEAHATAWKCRYPSEPLDDGDAHWRDICEADCEACPHFDSRYIVYPIEVSSIDVPEYPGEARADPDCGHLVKVTPVDDSYEGRTLVGLHLGDWPGMTCVSHDRQTKALSITDLPNPAILVLEDRRIVRGFASWWSRIRTAADLKGLSPDQLELLAAYADSMTVSGLAAEPKG